MTRGIYQAIWNSERHKLLVASHNSQGVWLEPNADIFLDEQVGTSRRRELDLAQRPLFYWVREVSRQTSLNHYKQYLYSW